MKPLIYTLSHSASETFPELI